MPGTFGERTPGNSFILELPSIDHTPDVATPFDCCSPASIDTLLLIPHFDPSNSDYFSIPVSFDASEELHGTADFIMELPERPKRSVTRSRNRSCEGSPILINTVPIEGPVQKTTLCSTASSPSPSVRLPVTMAYNEYGELVNIEKLRRPSTLSEMSRTDILRVTNKAYQHKIRDKMEEISYSLEEMDGKFPLIANGHLLKENHLSSWVFELPPSPNSELLTPGACHQPRYTTPHVLELGCGSGSWCFFAKEEHPTWTVHGVDDRNYWLSAHKELGMRDFLAPVSSRTEEEDYFSSSGLSDLSPKFTVRNVNSLLNHVNPIPMNSYGLVRGREIFHKVESYMNFLDSVRSILQPGGVVEFLELDPRPRTPFVGPLKRCTADCKTEAITGWPDKVADRLRDPNGCQDPVPGWSARVKESMKATLRPLDGVPAANLKTWLEASGFYDVKEFSFPIPIGGNTLRGQKLKDLLLYQLGLEDSIPKLEAELPKVEMDDLLSGIYHLNFHIVTGRKPQFLRTGDLLSDGTRNHMTPSTYHAMARLNDNKTLQWKRLRSRLDFDNDVSEVMKTIKITGGKGGA